MKNFEKYEEELKKIGIEFALKEYSVCACDGTYCDECTFGLKDNCNESRINWLYEEYAEPPFKPKYHEEYWTYWYKSKSATRMFWDENTNDISNWKLGNCFRTRKEAETKGKEIMEQLKKEYEEA